MRNAENVLLAPRLRADDIRPYGGGRGVAHDGGLHLGQDLAHQIGRGIIFLGMESLFIWFMIAMGGGYLYGLFIDNA